MPQHPDFILLVEDDPSVNQAVQRLLAAAGFNVRSFGSAEELLSESTASEPGCIVVDIHLPGISGFELVQRLKARGVCAPIVLMTAHDDAIHRRAANECGVSAYLTKPFSGSALVDAVATAIASRPGQPQGGPHSS